MGLGQIISLTDVHIRPVCANDDMAAITTLLHRAYKPLADAGMRYYASFQDEAATVERLSSGHGFVAIVHDQIVATITIYATLPTSICGWYNMTGVWHFGQFAVDPNCQGIGIGSLLMDFAEHFARLQGARELALDTAENAHDLIEYYTARQYLPIGHVQWDVTNYRSVVMSKELF